MCPSAEIKRNDIIFTASTRKHHIGVDSSATYTIDLTGLSCACVDTIATEADRDHMLKLIGTINHAKRTCKIVSKLKVKPFHSVNSPL